MKHKYLFLIVLIFGAVYSANAQNQISLGYGSTTQVTPSFKFSVFSDEAEVGFNDANNALFVAGYFDTGYDVAAGVTALKADFSVANFASFVSNFNELYSDDFGTSIGDASATNAGFMAVDKSFEHSPASVGLTPYIMALKGVTDFTNAGTASEVGLFTDSSFAVIPTGALIPETYNLKTISYDSVLLGGESLDQTLTANFGGLANQTGNIYSTQAIGAAVPEPSTYAMMLGALSFGFVYYKRRIAGKKTDQKQEA